MTDAVNALLKMLLLQMWLDPYLLSASYHTGLIAWIFPHSECNILDFLLTIPNV